MIRVNFLLFVFACLTKVCFLECAAKNIFSGSMHLMSFSALFSSLEIAEGCLRCLTMTNNDKS